MLLEVALVIEDTMKKTLLILLILSSKMFFAQAPTQIQPSNQARWPADCFTNISYVYSPGLNDCVAPGTGGGSATVIQVNGISTTPATPVNFNNSTPSAPAGYTNVLFQQSTSPSSISAYVSTAPPPSFVMNPVIPVGGTYDIVYPSSYTFVDGENTGSYASITSAKFIYPSRNGSACPGTCVDPKATYNFTLPASISPASVTAVYVGYNWSMYNTNLAASGQWVSFGLSCNYGTSSNITIGYIDGRVQSYPTQTTTISLPAITGSNFNTLSCPAQLGFASGTFTGGDTAYLNSFYMIVYHTGSTTTSNAINVYPPLFFNNNNFGIDPNYFSFTTMIPINQLPTISSLTAQRMYLVYDGTSSSDCTTGGASTIHWCYAGPGNGSWTAFGGSGGGGGLADPGSNGVLKRTALNTTAIASGTDIGSAFTDPSCVTNTVLRKDGTCMSVASASSVPGVSVAVSSGTQASTSCSSASTVTMTGLTTSMTLVAGYGADPTGITGWGATGGMIFQVWPSSANTASWKVCNQTSNSISYGAITFLVAVNSNIVNTGLTGWEDVVLQDGIDNTCATDVGAALLAIINGLSNTAPHTLYFGPGCYKMNAGIQIAATPGTKSGIHLVGAGENSTLFQSTCTNGYILWYNNTGTGDNWAGMNVTDIQFQDTSASHNACNDGLRLTQTAGNVLDRLVFQNFKGNTYSTATIAISGAAVTGVGTTFTAAMAPGVLQVNGIEAEVCTYNSATSLTLCSSAWPKGTVSPGAGYAIAYGGRPLTFDPGNSYTQYISVHDIMVLNSMYCIYSMGLTGSGGNSRITIDGKAGWCGQAGGRVTNAVGVFLGRHSDTFKIDMPVNNVTRCFVLDSAHSIDFNASDCENTTASMAPLTTCNGGVASQSCLVGYEISAESGAAGYGNTITDPYVYIVGTAFQIDNPAGSTDLTIIGFRNPYNNNTNYSFNGVTGCPGNGSGINATIITYDCNHTLVSNTVN